MLPAMDYYTDIYRHCLDKMARLSDKKTGESVLVDYGGGHGLLSLMAKADGWGQVIYIDNNPDSVSTATELASALGTRIDTLLCGDARDLNRWCREHNIEPDAIMGMDVIEHIYRLDQFFEQLPGVQQARPRMLFTTASNPCNPLKCYRLRRVMRSDEKGGDGHPGFYALRLQHLTKRWGFPDKKARRWARHTRGLDYNDIDRAVKEGILPEPADRYNTCDPLNGNWTERILPLSAYRELLETHRYGLSVENGWFNSGHTGIKRPAAQLLNRLNLRSCAPFLILTAEPIHRQR